MKIDNFALTMWQKCPAMFDLRINQFWTTRRRGGALGAGGALHLGMAKWYRTHDLSESILAISNGWPDEMPIDDWRTKEKVITTMIEYTKEYPVENWVVVGAPQEPVVEIAFTIGTAMFLPCEQCFLPMEQTIGDERFNPRCENCHAAREEIEYGGIYDLLIEFAGQHFIADHKTTSVMGPTYFRQFKPNNQMTGYIWAGNKLIGHHDFSGASRLQVSGALINAIGWKQKGKTEYKRDITARSPQEISEWLNWLYTECCAIQRHKILGEWPMRTESCMTKYGACMFHDVHVLAHPSEREKRLETDYVKDEWDYELREG